MADSPPMSPHQLFAYEAPVSLWGLVETYVPRHEWQEVKLILGESLVEQSLELQTEVCTLLEIWRDYRSETENQPMFHRLPEPPNARDRLKQEIKFFVDSVREKSGDKGRNFAEILSKHNKQVLDYVLEDTSYGSRPSTARNQQDGRETPMIPKTPDRLSISSTVSDEVESMQDKLNYLKLDEVVQHLRETMAQEVEWLTADIEFLQGCLEQEVDFRSQASVSREPTLTDLREERTKLEKELLSKDLGIPEALREPKHASVKSVSLMGKKPGPLLRGIPSAVSGQSHASQVSTSRPAPLKAAHNISKHVLTLNPDQAAKSHKTINNHISGKQTSQKPPVESLHKTHLARTVQNNSISNNKNVISNNELEAGDHTSRSDQLLQQRLVAVGPSQVTVRTARLPNNSQLVAVSGGAPHSSDSVLYSPAPPSASRPTSVRTGSAQRFRRMVSQCRDET